MNKVLDADEGRLIQGKRQSLMTLDDVDGLSLDDVSEEQVLEVLVEDAARGLLRFSLKVHEVRDEGVLVQRPDDGFWVTIPPSRIICSGGSL